MKKSYDVKLLEANATDITTGNYQHFLTPEELTEVKDKFAAKCKDIAIEEEKEKNRKDEYKVKMKPLTQDRDNYLSEIRSGIREMNGKLYHLADMEEEKMGIYNEHGILVSERPLYPGERQFRISAAFTGTDN